MLGVIFAAISAGASSIKSVIHRHVMKTESVYAYALIAHLCTALLFLPLALSVFELPTGATPWILFSISAVLWVTYSLVSFSSYKHTHVTLRETISQSRLILVLILSVIFLSEKLFLEKILGTITIFLGIMLMTYTKNKEISSIFDKGVKITLLSAVIISITVLLDKSALRYFRPEVYGFLLYAAQGIILLFFFKGKLAETKSLISNKAKFIALFVVLELIANYCYMKALSLEELSIIFPILRVGTLLTVILGMMFFEEERVNVTRKIIASLIVILGAVLISGKYILF